jgi:hypothetical protein
MGLADQFASQRAHPPLCLGRYVARLWILKSLNRGNFLRRLNVNERLNVNRRLNGMPSESGRGSGKLNGYEDVCESY